MTKYLSFTVYNFLLLFDMVAWCMFFFYVYQPYICKKLLKLLFPKCGEFSQGSVWLPPTITLLCKCSILDYDKKHQTL